jgi:hypothetical protein
MSQTSYSVGSAFAEALSQAGAFQRDPDRTDYRTVDFVNIGSHSAQVAHALMQSDPAEARRMLIHGASRMLIAAEQLAGQGASADVIPFPRDARPRLAVVS